MEGFFAESAGFLIQEVTRGLVVSYKILPFVAPVDWGTETYYDIRSDVRDNINLCNLMLSLFLRGTRKKRLVSGVDVYRMLEQLRSCSSHFDFIEA